MKILFVINNLGSGGAQNQLSLLALGLVERGHDVTVFTYHPQDFFEYRFANSSVRRIKAEKTDKIGVNVVKHLIDVIRNLEVDIVISFLRTPNFYAAIASKFAEVAFIPSYRSMTEFDTLKYPIRKSMEWVNSRASLIVTNSNHEKKRWIEKYPISENKWVTISNVVKTELAHSAKKLSDTTRILVVGSISSFKNGLNIIEALKILNEKANVNIKWIGRKVYDFNDTYYQKMNSALEAGSIEYLWTWQEPTIDIDKEYKECDYLLHASTKEGFPNVVCEALAHGKPCIVSNVLDHPLIIEEGRNGFLFDPNDVESIAGKILLATKVDQDAYQHMCSNAWKTAEKKFSKKSFLDAYENLIKSIA